VYLEEAHKRKMNDPAEKLSYGYIKQDMERYSRR
jgi:hypothetical protein